MNSPKASESCREVKGKAIFYGSHSFSSLLARSPELRVICLRLCQVLIHSNWAGAGSSPWPHVFPMIGTSNRINLHNLFMQIWLVLHFNLEVIRWNIRNDIVYSLTGARGRLRCDQCCVLPSMSRSANYVAVMLHAGNSFGNEFFQKLSVDKIQLKCLV